MISGTDPLRHAMTGVPHASASIAGRPKPSANAGVTTASAAGSFYIFGTAQNWWGALPEAPLAEVAVLMAAGLFVADKVNKLPGVLMFLGCYFVLVTGSAYLGDPASVAELYRTPDLQATLFFADPSGTALEFKAFRDVSRLFAK